MAYRSLGALRTLLRARLGFAAQGASGGANQVLLDSFLQNAQFQLYRMQDWRHLTDYQDKSLGVGQNLIDYPSQGTMASTNTAGRDKRVLRVESPIAGQYVKLDEGISTDMWSTMDTPSNPQRFERFAQILVYPKANQVYTLRVWFIADLLPFVEDNDVATLDDEMILLHAIATGKAHYRHPDAKVYEGQLDALLASVRGQSFSSSGVYRRGDATPGERKPAVLGRDA